ncbi:hypothetical protein J4Q44_G00290970 [Coregonus suidteri]|uniref:Immunoglobulin domain-containing protein n=1 Tax=Coregonus suidteri TaxID=861788 RepID=A0AAN8KTV8_9TELE
MRILLIVILLSFMTETGLKNSWQHSGRFSLYDNTGRNYFKVIIRQLTKQDEGTYWCGVDKPNAPDSYTKVELDVKKDDCCEKSVTETVYLGGEATISCNYPEGHEDSTKYFCKESNDFKTCVYMIAAYQRTAKAGRFSVSDNRRVKSYSVTISDLTEDDTGTYWCGVETSRTEDRYIALITQVKLRVISTSVVIMVSVSLVVLLLVISLIIVYRWKYNKATGDLTFSGVGLGVVLLLLGLLLFMFFRQRRDRDRRPTAAKHSARPLVPDSMTDNQDPDIGTITNPIYATATNQNPDTACDITTIYATATNPSPDDIYSNVGP